MDPGSVDHKDLFKLVPNENYQFYSWWLKWDQT